MELRDSVMELRAVFLAIAAFSAQRKFGWVGGAVAMALFCVVAYSLGWFEAVP